MSARCAVAVVISGGPIDRSCAPPIVFDHVVAADGGYDAALAVGVQPTHLVGDLDSIGDAGREHAERRGVAISRHRPDKDETDTALALMLAVELGVDDLTVIGPADAGRLDHLLGVLAVLGDPRLADCSTITAHMAGATVHVVHPGRTIHLPLRAGTTLSLLALHGECDGVELTGAEWELTGARLAATTSLGVSNVARGPVSATVRTGVLSLVVPRHPLVEEVHP